MTVWIYVNTRKQVGDNDHLRVFADQDAARKWSGEHDREGVAFEYDGLKRTSALKEMFLQMKDDAQTANSLARALRRQKHPPADFRLG